MSFVWRGHWQVRDESGRRKYLNGEERARFLASADALTPELRALCHVLAFTGCRISEALSITRDHVDSTGALTIATLKRRRSHYRTIPVPLSLVAMLIALPGHQDGRFWTMHRSTAWRQVKSLMEEAAIKGPMASCKGLRHGFGLAAAASGVPPSLIAKWLGHASLTTTAIYLDAVGTEERLFAQRLW